MSPEVAEYILKVARYMFFYGRVSRPGNIVAGGAPEHGLPPVRTSPDEYRYTFSDGSNLGIDFDLVPTIGNWKAGIMECSLHTEHWSATWATKARETGSIEMHYADHDNFLWMTVHGNVEKMFRDLVLIRMFHGEL